MRKIFKRGITTLLSLSLCITLVACGKKDLHKGVFISKWDNFYEEDNIRFYYEKQKEPNLQKLKVKYDLDEVVEHSKDDFDKALLLMSWINKKIKYNKGSISTKEDALSILKVAENNNTLSDKDFAIVYSQCAASLGIYTRRGEFRTRDSQYDGKHSYYKVCEVWNNKYSKWVMLDVVNNCYVEMNGKPLSALEVLNSGMKNVNTKGIDNIEKYIKKIKPYLYTYTIEIDNNIYGISKSNSFITYVPEKDMPEIMIEGGIIRPTIYVKEDVLFKKPPTSDCKNNKDKKPTLIFSKKNSNEKSSNIEEITLFGAVFQDSGMLEGYYISVNNKPWMDVKRYFTVTLEEGDNNIKLSIDKKNVLREVSIVNKTKDGK